MFIRHKKQKVRNMIFYLLNIVIPLLLGLTFYLFFSPAAHVSQWVYEKLKLETLQPATTFGRWIGRQLFLRNFFCDACWSYALSFSVSGALGGKGKRLVLSLMISILFCFALEFAQLLPYVDGTFDGLDILVELLICCIAHLLIYIYYAKEKLK